MNRHGKSVGKWISILYRHAQSYFAGQMKSYNIGSGQYTFLLALYDRDGISQEELSNQLMIDKGTTARAINKLEKAGYVIRKTNTEDRRAYNLFITDKAREIKSALCKTSGSWTDILVADLSQEEREKLYVILKKMVNSTMLYMKENGQ